MGYVRLWRRKQILPGVTLNLSKSGLSTSFGVRGFHYTVGHHRRRTTIGIPGTGVYYTTYSHPHARHATARRAAPAVPAELSTPSLGAMPPWQKILSGVLMTLTVIAAPIGIPLILIGVCQLASKTWRMRALVHKAERRIDPQQRKALLDRAWALRPGSAEVLAPLAEWHFDAQDWASAIDLYRRYLAAAPSDWLAHAHLARALHSAGRFEEAITELEKIRAGAPLAEDSHASVSANLALALCATGQVSRAVEVVKTEPLQKHNLGPGLLQALYMRAACHALLGQKAQALQDMDRIYAIKPDYPDLDKDRAAMQAGTFRLDLPAAQAPPVPGAAITSSDVAAAPTGDGGAAAPIAVSVSEATVARAPEEGGATPTPSPGPVAPAAEGRSTEPSHAGSTPAARQTILSPDRRYWWDGEGWQDTTMTAPPDSPRSPDGRWWWDGATWRPLPTAQPVPR